MPDRVLEVEFRATPRRGPGESLRRLCGPRWSTREPGGCRQLFDGLKRVASTNQCVSAHGPAWRFLNRRKDEEATAPAPAGVLRRLQLPSITANANRASSSAPSSSGCSVGSRGAWSRQLLILLRRCVRRHDLKPDVVDEATRSRDNEE